ncbi:serine hydrolase [Streptomyces sp. NEAU-174]|uniref:serine hydrolase n=1 Tax=Streptomyces sp. NEAU-174 TaxID=3458254 RepID=UPI0040440CBF
MTRGQRIDDLNVIAIPEQPALSPDGTRSVYVLRTVNTGADRNERAIWLAGSRTGRPVRLTHGSADSAPAWSPDGRSVAFLRAQNGPPQVWLLPMEGGEPEQLTSLPLGAGAPVWSPDSTRIAFSTAVDLAAGDEEDSSAQPRSSKDPIVADRLDYQADGAGLLRSVRGHLHVLDVRSRECHQVTTGDWHAGGPSWSPDGKTLAFTAATASDADLRYRAPVHLLDVHDRTAAPRQIGLVQGSGGPIIWTPDGSALLVVGTAKGPVGQAGLHRLAVDGSGSTDLAAPLDRNVMPGGPAYPGAAPQLTGDGETVLFCVRDRGCTHVYSVPATGGTPRAVVAGAGRHVLGMSVMGSTAAIVLATPMSYGEIVFVDLTSGTETVATEHGAVFEGTELYPRQERDFHISDGTVVHGWLIRDSAAQGPQPLLLDIHGGPHNAWNGAADDGHLYHQELVARGWTVLLLNPRGSDGYGAAFYNGAIGAWGEADAKDFLEPVDTLVAEGIADGARLAVSGYSYGGYMTCYLTSRDGRFKAAVPGGMVGDLTSMVGTADGGQYLSTYELRGRPWETPERFAAMSPLARVGQVTTPTLILHGTEDRACPVGQAQQWHTALRERGVPARLVLYPGGTHLFILEGQPSHRIDYGRRLVDWVEQYAGSADGPRRARIDARHWQRRLTELAHKHGVPGAVLGILRLRPGGEDELVEAAYGVLNKDTGVTTTTDSVFQIGSVSKVWTTTAVMQMVDEGLLSLDTPVIDLLPELPLIDAELAKRVTMRHLLTHTSGIDGDVFTDTGRGDDCLERYVAQLCDVAQIHPLGATWSYCNSGFSLAGRVMEKLTGQTWDEAMRKRLFEPLGLERTVTLPEEALLHRTAVGHDSEATQEPVRAPVWGLPRSLGPAGLISASAADVLRFARLHLTGGLTEDGTRILSAESVAAMADKHADLPDKHMLGDSWGLGWIRLAWDGQRLIGHDGNTIGQAAYLRLLPGENLAVTLLTNCGDARDLYMELFREIFAELADVTVPQPLAPPAVPVPVTADTHLGTYERAGTKYEVFHADGGPMLRETVTGLLAELTPEPVHEYPMVPVEDNLFLVFEKRTRTWMPVTFYTLPTGERYVHYAVRATPKVA